MIDIENFDKSTPAYDYNGCTVDKVESIDYKTFFEKFMLLNIPCIIKDIALKWECTKKWIKDETINYSYLKDEYGDLQAPVANCNTIKYNSQCKNLLTVSNYMQYLIGSRHDGLLYLKDWHLKRVRPNDKFYDVPKIFASDWLNEFAIDQHEDDFMFVYIGPKDSWTPLHVDVYCAYSWSVNVIGRKKWILFPPGEEEKLKDSLGNLPVLFIPDKFHQVKYFEIVQEKGEAIFVPSGWHHQVVNLVDTISVNHNWINACNIQFVWSAMQNSLLSVELEIREFKDSPEFGTQCQLILKSLFGMDFMLFADFISHIGKKRIRQLKENLTDVKFLIGKNHIIFDLLSISNIIASLRDHPLFVNKTLSLKEDLIDVQNSISQILKSTYFN